MDVKEAVQVARNCVIELFAEEGIVDFRPEEVDFESGIWVVTIGFS